MSASCEIVLLLCRLPLGSWGEDFCDMTVLLLTTSCESVIISKFKEEGKREEKGGRERKESNSQTGQAYGFH